MHLRSALRAQTAGEAFLPFAAQMQRLLSNGLDFVLRYGRHVAIPWSTLLPAFPHVLPLRPDNARPEPGPELASSSSSVMQPLLAPCMAMRNLVQNYVRHASNRLEVRAVIVRVGCASFGQISNLVLSRR